MEFDMKYLSSMRTPKNKAELAFFNEAISKGWNLTRKGWADFFCWKDGKIMVVEVKKKRGHNLKRHQHFLFEQLVKFGVPCYTWTPDGGLKSFPVSKSL